MLHRISALRADVPITFIYGARSWVDRYAIITIYFEEWVHVKFEIKIQAPRTNYKGNQERLFCRTSRNNSLVLIRKIVIFFYKMFSTDFR